MPAKSSMAVEPGFATLGLDDRLVASLAELGYEEPTPIQREAIPMLLEARDLVGQAATGTGKTAAFALPILHRLAGRTDPNARPFGLVLVPTRELAMQVANAVHKYGQSIKASVLPIYGGQAYGPQLRTLERGTDIVIATPGRALDLIRGKKLRLNHVQVVILDEADEMLDMGFAEDIESILAETPEQRQTVLFSATMPPRIAAIARRHLKDPVKIKIAAEASVAGTAARVAQTAYIVPRGHKLAALGRVLDVENPVSAIVFCRRRNEVDELTESLTARGYRAEALHGGMTQEQRNRVMNKFRGEAADLLIATDVAARGLDIQHLSHVINFDVPCEAESYVHRIGRVGRAGREGVAITLAEPREHRQLREIEKSTGQKLTIAKIPTVADLRARRLELTRASIREAIVEGGLDRYRVVVGSLSDEFDLMEIAMATAKLLHRTNGAEEQDKDEIPPVELDSDRPRRGRASERGAGKPAGPRKSRKARSGGEPSGMMVRIFINAGRAAGVRPQDLVGAITGEAGLTGRQVGGIDIADRFSLVEVPGDRADDVIAALRGTRIKGKKVTAKRDAR